ncbi:transposase [Botrimarina mediterranea]|uniref:transposase n=1 Tax=Botrimarina mediterranea TaxID=2528022 RepID=UPI001189F5A9|nr:hypothetical protein K2D_19680 [Planctomycetes bacterium K2D]
MQDRELYEKILGSEAPWLVSRVELDALNHRILVRVEHPQETKFGCPECDRELPCYDHSEERQWRHLAEGINSKIMAIKRRVGGYRNRQNFETAIFFFYCSGLDLHPQRNRMDL